MTKKFDGFDNYYSAHEAAQQLSLSHGRPIRPDYVRKMARSQKHRIRIRWKGNRMFYHKDDIAACAIGEKRSA